jgi:hypothetical protein
MAPLRIKRQPDPDPRDKMLIDLQKVIEQWTEQSFDVILMWDANEIMDIPKSKLTGFMEKTSLSPIHNTLPSATYARGSSCIDFIMATPRVHTATVAADYTSFYDGIWHSDHLGVFVDISAPALFHGTTPNIDVKPKRLLTSNNNKQVFKFVKNLEKSNILPKLLTDLEELATHHTWNSSHHTAFENIDKSFTKLLIQTEAPCALPHYAEWHPKLHHCYLIVKYWKIKNSG